MRDDSYLQFIRFLKANQGFARLLPNGLQVKMQSHFRTQFMNRLQSFDVQQVIKHKYSIGEQQEIKAQFAQIEQKPIKVLGLNFRHNLYNSAGMFKSTQGYQFVNELKAGAFTFGTTTANPRKGNTKNNIQHPFISLEESGIALNFLGLPNAGDAIMSQHHFDNKDELCPVIVSVMRSPDFDSKEAMEKLIQSLWLYHNNSTIDMIEINESCPNVKASIDDVTSRLSYIKQQFLDKRTRHLPVVIKLSNQISGEQLQSITEQLIHLQFDGVIVGNTVTDYKNYSQYLHAKDRSLFNYFTEQFGGGLSGVVLKDTSLRNVETVAETVEKLKPNFEFAIIRCGGINSAKDLMDSAEYGVSLNQWYSGFIENFLRDDVKTYINMKA